jgi:RimJ/RimL family protein N-acetyltransferase
MVSDPVDLSTPRLRLRPLQFEDAPGYGELLADRRVHPLVVEGGPVAAHAIRGRISHKRRVWREGTGVTWAVLHGGSFVGYVALHGLGAPRVSISYAILPAVQRRGFATEAIAAALGGAARLGATQVEARTLHDNEVSVRVLVRVGFVEIEPAADPPRRVFVWSAPGPARPPT